MDKRLSKLPLALTALLVLLLAWMLGKMFAHYWDVAPNWSVPILKPLLSERSQAGEDVFLFGNPPKVTANPVPVAQVVMTDKVTDTTLKLQLLGLIDLGSRGVAIIQNGNKTLVVAQGESIQNNVTLVDVLADGIIINNQGKQERLLLEDATKNLINRPALTSKSESNITGRLSMQAQEKLNGIGDQLRKSPMAISQYIKFQPLNEGGVWVGVKIWSKSDPELYKSIGFEEGDMLKKVNGHSIQEMVKNPKLLQEFLALDQFDLVLERNGSPVIVDVNFR